MKPAPEELHGPGSQRAVIIQERRGEGETKTGRSEGESTIHLPAHHVSVGEVYLAESISSGVPGWKDRFQKGIFKIMVFYS
ncbi:MAG: hypothetical protein CW742_10645 [Methanoregula sp.]|nr:MAG: hypothetical protein CW742_10645 [Methanoregula sp.]